jgi:hypothetical protein
MSEFGERADQLVLENSIAMYQVRRDAFVERLAGLRNLSLRLVPDVARLASGANDRLVPKADFRDQESRGASCVASSASACRSSAAAEARWLTNSWSRSWTSRPRAQRGLPPTDELLRQRHAGSFGLREA